MIVGDGIGEYPRDALMGDEMLDGSRAFPTPCIKTSGPQNVPNVCGVICELNPFHNGHAYLFRALRE
ncbi:MAG: nucleotidyltransferase family protein, partial [Clostridia bacterium]|nr:nucleotidyltransferase family protein [Clostridia bacterium]